MSFSRHNTIPFSMPFIFEVDGLGNGTLVEPFLIILVTTTKHVPSAIGLPWNVMPVPHTTPKLHGIQLVRSKTSTFILGFKISYKHVEHNIYQTIV